MGNNAQWTNSGGALSTTAKTIKVGFAPIVAPTLTLPTIAQASSTSATVGSTTNVGDGVMRAVVTTSPTKPSVVQLKAGQSHLGTAASGVATPLTITSTGAKTLSVTGLPSGTPLYAHLLHTDALGNDSNIVTSAQLVLTSSAMTLTGANFGTNANFAPLYFIDFRNTNDGDTWAQATGDSGGTFSFTGGNKGANTASRVDMTEGLSIGGGNWYQEINNLAVNDEWFTHFGVDLPTGIKDITVFKHVKIDHTAGTVVQNTQMKGTRVITNTSRDYASTTAYPNVAGSHYLGPDNALGYGEITGLYHPSFSGAVEQAVSGRLSDTPAGMTAVGTWQCVLSQYAVNTAVGVADGLYRVWQKGIQYYNHSINLTDTPATTEFRGVMFNPGMANGFGDGNSWRVKHARMVVLKGKAWCAFGNASTFASCTDLLVVEPTYWSDTSIGFNPRGTRPTGYNWMYVMNSAGTLVNTTGLTSFA